MEKQITIFGVPSCSGGNAPGCLYGPDAIRVKLEPVLHKRAIEFEDLGDLDVPGTCTVTNIHERCLPEFREIAEEVENFTLQRDLCAPDKFPVLLGGDHSVSYGFIKASAKNRRLGLIWFDAHGDFNTPDISPSGNIHGMVLAALAGHGIAEDLGHGAPIIQEKNICIVGARNIDPKEQELLNRTGVHIFTIKEIRERGLGAITREALELAARETDGIHLSFDLDFFDPSSAPGVGAPEGHGIIADELDTITKVTKDYKIVSMDVVELNPMRDKDNKATKLAADIIAGITHP